MPIYRTEKNKDYVVMSNVFLQRKDLSIKAKGLLAYMLSLSAMGIYAEVTPELQTVGLLKPYMRFTKNLCPKILHWTSLRWIFPRSVYRYRKICRWFHRRVTK